MRKVDQNKKQKKDSLLDAAFRLFMENGFHKTSISDIVNQAGVAKGTFYLYFTDKYDLRNKLISHKAVQVFSNAYNALLNTEIKAFEEQVIFIIDHILTQFQKDHSLVFFISKHLSWALFKNALIDAPDDGQENIYEDYCRLLEESGLRFNDPEIMIYMIIELISGTSYNSILYNQPKPIEELKPYLYETVKSIIRQNLIPDDSNV
ncbi:MAG: TetR/AcrR family transcriptional regulator [Lachnospiraceae bacterium]